ncbi:MAG: DUF371 domain-containing protein [Candidatus Bathyarchaeia archaeon]
MTHQLREQILAYGHENVLAIHPSTLMFTKDKELSKQGDCIVAVGADKAVVDLSVEFKRKLRDPNTRLTVLIEVDGLTQQVTAYGSVKLDLTSNVDMVVRKSDFTSERTLAVKADKAAVDLPREFIEKLKNPNQQVKITLTLT